jgi:hypothetical protein
LLSPVDGERLDLNQTELKWSPVEGADHYRVQFSYTLEDPSPHKYSFASIQTKQPCLNLNRLTGRETQRVAEYLLKGRTGSWQIYALDAAGRTIGKSLEERRFLVLDSLNVSD